MKKRDLRRERIQNVQREFQTALLALNLLATQIQKDPAALAAHDLKQTDFRRLRSNLEITFLIRLFAEFESASRDYWNSIKESHPKISDLVDGLAARRSIPHTELRQVHDVRNYRNVLVHEDAATAVPVPFFDAVRHLQKFVGRLPADW